MAVRRGERVSITESYFLSPPDCPTDCLCHGPSKEKVARLVNDHVRYPWSHHGVYVLACRKRSESSAKRIALRELRNKNGNRIKKPPSWVTAATNAEHLIYVGLSKKMVTRIHDHAHGKGANFTQVFPPTRVLDIDWYPTLAESYREEPIKAARLRERFPEAYVSQPG